MGWGDRTDSDPIRVTDIRLTERANTYAADGTDESAINRLEGLKV